MKIKSRQRAFSLVELVIVVVIIGVIAAIAVPRISRGAKGAGESALRGSLTVLRNAIDMYSAEHQGQFPGTDGTEATFIAQLTDKTDVGGTPGTDYGPYLRKVPPVPVGPNAGKASGLIFDNVSDPLSLGVNEGTATAGWVYNKDTGEIIPNTDDTDDNLVKYHDY
jgi:prepilin-type N-terminal cleavage/methylation domain-containing protein